MISLSKKHHYHHQACTFQEGNNRITAKLGEGRESALWYFKFFHLGEWCHSCHPDCGQFYAFTKVSYYFRKCVQLLRDMIFYTSWFTEALNILLVKGQWVGVDHHPFCFRDDRMVLINICKIFPMAHSCRKTYHS